MAVPREFSSLHNLRVVRRNARSKNLVFRSARQEKLSSEEITDFVNLGVRTIVDLRDPNEYGTGIGERHLDPIYRFHIAEVPKFAGNFNESVNIIPLSRSIPQGSSLYRRTFVPVTSRFYFKYYCARESLSLASFLFLLSLDLVSFFRFEFLKAAVVRQLKVNGLSWFYTFTLQFAGASICSALKIIAQPENLPALLNCFYGKDRTGLVSALVLHVMGEPYDVIRDDYVASEAGLERSRDADKEELSRDFGFTGGEDFHHATAENIDTAFEFLYKKYGSVDKYLDSIGFDEKWRQKTRECLK